MAKLDGNKRISRDDMPNSQDWIDPFLTNQNQVNDSVVNAIRGSLTMQDNTTSGYYTGKFVHGIERVIRNPLIKTSTKGPSPIGVQAVNCQKLYTDAVSLASPVVSSVALRYLNSNDPTAPEQVGITVQYAPPLGDITVVRDTTSPNFTTAVSASVPFERIEHQIGSAITWSSSANTALIFNALGIVQIGYGFQWSNAAAGTSYETDVRGTAFSRKCAPSRVAPVTFASNSGVDIFPVASVGGNMTILGTQTSGGSIGIVADGFVRPSFWARYIAPDPATTANVTLFFHGG